MVEAAHQGTSGSLIPDRLINLGGHYSRCLRNWRENFAGNFESLIVPALKEGNKGITKSDIEIFRRKWMVSSLLPFTQRENFTTDAVHTCN